jgi:hypothetical protein
MNVRFACPVCGSSVRVNFPGSPEWRCGQCDHHDRLKTKADEPALNQCVVCGNAELYKKKDFPHGLGLAIVALACLASVVPYWFYQQWWTWGILLGALAIDVGLYLLVGDVVVCYRCGAHHRGFAQQAAHQPFELTIHERYRQERIRRELAASAARREPG